MKTTLNALASSCHEMARSHGFWDLTPNIPEKLCLIHSEISEALEVFRSGGLIAQPAYTEDGKPIGFDSELADVIIRLLDLSGGLGIDIDRAVEEKMKYNENRTYRHGNKLA